MSKQLLESNPCSTNLPQKLATPASEDLDALSARGIVELINSEDAGVADAVGHEAATIGKAVDVIAHRLGHGGRLVYIGAGTSGRLGILDAAECPPTFNSDPSQVVGIIAGGPGAMLKAVEGAEDSPELAKEDLRGIDLCSQDVVVGIATSGPHAVCPRRTRLRTAAKALMPSA